MTASTLPHIPKLRQRLLNQGTLLFSAFGASQALSFTRNAMIGHWLSRGDFGIAASITLMLQMLEILSDVGADRLILQADDGDDPSLIATAHAVMLVRGIVIALIVLIAGIPAAGFFHVGHAWPAFACAALVPFVKGFMHLDYRRQQRALENRPYVIIEVLPQVMALMALAPLLSIEPSYWAVVWIAVGQALVMVATSHAVAARPFRVAVDRVFLQRIVEFGWPIWLSAFPLVAVYQGDRTLIGNMLGIDALGGYAAAFMITMVPALMAAKIGNAVILPVLAQVKDQPLEFARRYVVTCEAVSIAATIYAACFLIAGGALLPMVFGPNFTGLGPVVAWLGLMWMMRMVQSVPGMALMALGLTRPFLEAGLIRAAALAGVFIALNHGHGLAGAAAAGVAGELASLIYIFWRLGRLIPGLDRSSLLGLSLLVPGIALAVAVSMMLDATGASIGPVLAVAATTSLLLLAGGLLALPQLRVGIVSAWRRHATRSGTYKSVSGDNLGDALAPLKHTA